MRKPRPRLAVAVVGTLFIALSSLALMPGRSEAAPAIDKDLLPPPGATVLQSAPGPQMQDPITHSPVVLPYFNQFPLPEGPIGDPKKTYTFCFSQALIRHPWPVAERGSAMIEAARHPNVKVLYYNTDNDALKQIQDLDTCAAEKPDAIMVYPQATAPLTPEIEKLHRQGLRIVGMERTVATRDYDSWIFLDGLAETRDLAEAAGKLLSGKGIVAEEPGALGSSPQIIRHYGFTTATEKLYPDIKIVVTPPTNYSQAQGYSVALQFLESPQGKDINAWFVQSGTMALGVAQAMKSLTRTTLPIFTIDGSKPEVQAVERGEIYAIAPHTPLHGDLALRLSIYLTLGKEVPKDILLAKLPLITRANAADELPKAWGTLGATHGY